MKTGLSLVNSAATRLTARANGWRVIRKTMPGSASGVKNYTAEPVAFSGDGATIEAFRFCRQSQNKLA